MYQEPHLQMLVAPRACDDPAQLSSGLRAEDFGGPMTDDDRPRRREPLQAQRSTAAEEPISEDELAASTAPLPPAPPPQAPRPPTGWWLASDGKWYPPEQHASATAAPPPPTAAPMSRDVASDRRATWLVLGGAIAASLGALLPWATVDIGFASVSKAGTSGDGIITLCLAVVVIILAGFGYQRGMTSKTATWSVVLGVLVLAVGIYDTIDVTSRAADLEIGNATVGPGLWLTDIAAVVLIVGALMTRGVARRSGVGHT